jgi:hypothetical protein
MGQVGAPEEDNPSPGSPAADGPASQDGTPSPREDIDRAEALFQRIMRGPVDDAVRSEFAAALDRCGLTPEQRDALVRRVIRAAQARLRG